MSGDQLIKFDAQRGAGPAVGSGLYAGNASNKFVTFSDHYLAVLFDVFCDSRHHLISRLGFANVNV